MYKETSAFVVSNIYHRMFQLQICSSYTCDYAAHIKCIISAIFDFSPSDTTQLKHRHAAYLYIEYVVYVRLIFFSYVRLIYASMENVDFCFI